MAWAFPGSYRPRPSQLTSQSVKEHLGTDDHRHMASQKLLPLMKSYRERRAGGGANGERTRVGDRWGTSGRDGKTLTGDCHSYSNCDIH